MQVEEYCRNLNQGFIRYQVQVICARSSPDSIKESHQCLAASNGVPALYQVRSGGQPEQLSVLRTPYRTVTGISLQVRIMANLPAR
jgi:hypothetical protein